MYSYSASTSGDVSSTTFKPATTIHTEHMKTVRAVAWSPSGQTLATASFDSNVGIWEQERDDDEDDDEGEGRLNPTADWECVGTLEGHETECKSVAYSCTGTLLASCSRDKSVWVWEVQPDAEFECMGVLLEHSQDVKCVAWHPQEEILASASYDDTIKLYIDDPSDDWYCFTTLQGHTSTVWSLAWSPDGRYLASASDDQTVRIWAYVDTNSTGDGADAKRVLKVKPPSVQASSSGQGRWIQVAEIEAGERSVYSVTWTSKPGSQKDADGNVNLGLLAAAGSDGVIRVWGITEPAKVAVGVEHKLVASYADAHGVHDINAISWCPRKGYETLLATAGDDQCIRVWDVVLGSSSQQYQVWLNREYDCKRLAPTDCFVRFERRFENVDLKMAMKGRMVQASRST
ncbi:CIAO1 [Coprinopsis cinerea okayama7|uniref:Probable cytosolic iron-sulfur protein assembly protein 1 n=1 Tax=Coprinopsis cinerea (strain Okayama-7 / 130 / ATCC MYA-4618 / FGSC 9003) TaxID=240176 RepID=A8PCL8_COPC7|nr:CIAO1 [Coprinopsis cinerea okayama7\|eukprot:XP_001840430.2 CIAO1 [Coprinopsis cinerea okayama7\